MNITYLCDCPSDVDQGVLRPAIIEGGRIVLICDDGYDLWLHPDDVGRSPAYWPKAPDWKITDDISMPNKEWRWAKLEDLQDLDWNVEWKSMPEDR